MNIKTNHKIFIFLAIIFLLAYSLLATKPLGSDIFFEPVWTHSIEAQTEEQKSNLDFSQNYETFILGNHFGYFTPEGTLLSVGSTEHKISASNFGWATYPFNAQETSIYKPDGSIRFTVSEPGFVHLVKDRIFLFTPGGDGLCEFDAQGQKMWTLEHSSPITAFNTSQEGTIIGYADGKLVGLNKTGSELFSFYPGGSNYNVIFGAAISNDGTMAACISGLDKQRFVLIKIKGNQQKIVFHTYFDTSLRRQAYVGFESKNNYAFYESEGRINFIDCNQYTTGSIPIQGKVIQVGENPEDSLFTVLAKNENTYSLLAVERPDHLVTSTSFTANNAFLIQQNNIIYIGIDKKISRINIKGQK